LKDPVRRKLDRYKLTGPIDPAHFFPTLEDAVAAHRALTGVAWVDTSTPERPAGPDGAARAAGPDGAARAAGPDGAARAAGPDGATHIDSADTDPRGDDHDRTRAVDPGTGAVHQ
jgi:hypothetical protein